MLKTYKFVEIVVNCYKFESIVNFRVFPGTEIKFRFKERLKKENFLPTLFSTDKIGKFVTRTVHSCNYKNYQTA